MATKPVPNLKLEIDQRVKLGTADLSEGPDRTRIRALAYALPQCGLTLELESNALDGPALVTLYACYRTNTRERTP